MFGKNIMTSTINDIKKQATETFEKLGFPKKSEDWLYWQPVAFKERFDIPLDDITIKSDPRPSADVKLINGTIFENNLSRKGVTFDYANNLEGSGSSNSVEKARLFISFIRVLKRILVSFSFNVNSCHSDMSIELNFCL